MSTLQQREREREIQREREREQERQPSQVNRERNREASETESKLEAKLKELEEKGLVRLERTASGDLDIEVIPVTVEKIVTQTGRSTSARVLLCLASKMKGVMNCLFFTVL